MTRITSTSATSVQGKGGVATKKQFKQVRQTGTVDQYAIQNGPCSMNFFGAGYLKADWE